MSPPLPPVAILAGGLGTRLGGLAGASPKAMVEVAGAPFIAHQLRLLRARGAKRVVLCVGHLGEQIEAFVGDGADFGLNVSYSWEREELLGTGGAVRKALPQLGGRFFVTYGDAYLDISYEKVLAAFDSSGCPALMTVFCNNNQWDVSNVEFADGIVKAYSKADISPTMKHIDYGVLVFSALAFERTQDPVFDLVDLLGRLVKGSMLAGYEVENRFYEIGTPEGLAETAAYLAARAR